MSGIATGTALLISAGVGLAATGAEMGYEMSQSTPTAPNTASTDAQASTDAAQAQAAALTKRRGMASTMMTSPMGAGAAQTQKTTLG